MGQNNRRSGYPRGSSQQGNRGARGANGRHAGYQLYGGDAHGLYNSGYSTGGRRNNRSTMIYGKQRKTWPKVVLALAIVLIVIACVWQFACGGRNHSGGSGHAGNDVCFAGIDTHRNL